MGTDGTDSGRLDMPFVGIPSFLRAPVQTDASRIDADVAILGAPFDEGSPFLPGSRFGPRSIREHTLRFVSGEDGTCRLTMSLSASSSPASARTAPVSRSNSGFGVRAV